MGAPNRCGERQMTAEGAEKSQQYHKYFLHYSTFASERPPVQTWGRQTCFLPRAPFNLVTPLEQRFASLSLTCSLAEQFELNTHDFHFIFYLLFVFVHIRFLRTKL